jgi:hypothetical protein
MMILTLLEALVGPPTASPRLLGFDVRGERQFSKFVTHGSAVPFRL